MVAPGVSFGPRWNSGIEKQDAQCLQCHTKEAKRSLGLETAQMNRTHFYSGTGVEANQLDTLDLGHLLKVGKTGNVGFFNFLFDFAKLTAAFERLLFHALPALRNIRGGCPAHKSGQAHRKKIHQRVGP